MNEFIPNKALEKIPSTPNKDVKPDPFTFFGLPQYADITEIESAYQQGLSLLDRTGNTDPRARALLDEMYVRANRLTIEDAQDLPLHPFLLGEAIREADKIAKKYEDERTDRAFQSSLPAGFHKKAKALIERWKQVKFNKTKYGDPRESGVLPRLAQENFNETFPSDGEKALFREWLGYNYEHRDKRNKSPKTETDVFAEVTIDPSSKNKTR